MTHPRRTLGHALLALATAFGLLGTVLQPADHVHFEGGHVVHHSHPTFGPHSHLAPHVYDRDDAAAVLLHARTPAAGHAVASLATTGYEDRELDPERDDLAHLIARENASHRRNPHAGGPQSDLSARRRDHRHDLPTPSKSAPKSLPHMVWTTLALAMAPLLPVPAAPPAIAQAHSRPRVAPEAATRPLPLPRGPPA